MLFFRILQIDDSQRVQLQAVGSTQPLLVWYPYDQLKPYVRPEADRLSDTNFVPKPPTPLPDEYAEKLLVTGKICLTSGEEQQPPGTAKWESILAHGKASSSVVNQSLKDHTYSLISDNHPFSGDTSSEHLNRKDSFCDDVIFVGTACPPPKRYPDPLPASSHSAQFQDAAALKRNLETVESNSWLEDDEIDHTQDQSLQDHTYSIPCDNHVGTCQEEKSYPFSDDRSSEHLKYKDSFCDVIFLGTVPPPKRHPDPLPVSSQSAPFQDAATLKRILITVESNDSWLTDDEIDHTQGLLLQKFPQMPGLQNRMLFGPLHAPRVAAPAKGFVQILNLNNSHWLCASTVGCEAGIINIYDSLYEGIYSKKLLNELARMLHTSHSEMQINWQDCCKQTGHSDCGLYALAFATAICHGDNPSNIIFSQKMLRGHLAECIRKGKITMFPTSGYRVPNQPKCILRVPLVCHCRMPSDSGLELAYCTGCKKWIHSICDDGPSPAQKTHKVKFLCKKCLVQSVM